MYVCVNQAPFTNKELQKSIMIRSKLRKKTESNKKVYCKQRNISVKILHKTQNQFCSKLEVSTIAHNKRFWKTVKNFSIKSKQLL